MRYQTVDTASLMSEVSLGHIDTRGTHRACLHATLSGGHLGGLTHDTPPSHYTHTHAPHQPWSLLKVTPGLTQPGLQLRGTHRVGSATPQLSLGLQLLLHLLLKVPDYRKQQGTLALS